MWPNCLDYKLALFWKASKPWTSKRKFLTVFVIHQEQQRLLETLDFKKSQLRQRQV